MTYPIGAGPEAGAFTAGGYQAASGQAVTGDQRYVMPTVIARQAVRLTTATRDMVFLSTFGPPGPGKGWLVQRVTMSARSQAAAWIFVGGLAPENLVAGTPGGSMDDYDPVNHIPVNSNESLHVKWRIRSFDMVEAWARIEYREVPV